MPTNTSSYLKLEIGHVLVSVLRWPAAAMYRLSSMTFGFDVSIQQLKIDPAWNLIRKKLGFQH